MRIRNLFLILGLSIMALSILANEIDKPKGIIRGQLKMDDSWSQKIYLSHIPTFEDIHAMSKEMVISEADIDSLGNFAFALDFLPENDNLFRLHLVKKDNSRYSITIGGEDENHAFVVANRHSYITITNHDAIPPLRRVSFGNSVVNAELQALREMIFYSDSLSSESGLARRNFMKEKLVEQLVETADTTSMPLVALFALYNMDYKAHCHTDETYYQRFQDRWKAQNNRYFDAFFGTLPVQKTQPSYASNIIAGIALVSFGFFLGRLRFRRNNRIKTLSVQERKIYDLLRTGATNQEIADNFNIGINTVKSHVSKILAKMKVKSRKEILNM